MSLSVTISKRNSGSAVMIVGGVINYNPRTIVHVYGQTPVIDGRRVLIHDYPSHGGARLGHLRDFTVGAVSGIHTTDEGSSGSQPASLDWASRWDCW